MKTPNRVLQAIGAQPIPLEGESSKPTEAADSVIEQPMRRANKKGAASKPRRRPSAVMSRGSRQIVNARIPDKQHKAIAKLVFDLRLDGNDVSAWKLVASWIHAEPATREAARQLLATHGDDIAVRPGERVTIHVEIPIDQWKQLQRWSFEIKESGGEGAIWQLLTCVIAKHAGTPAAALDAIDAWESLESIAA